MVRVADLFALQEVDSQIDALQRTLDELRNRPEQSEEVAAAKSQAEALEEQRHAIESEQRLAGFDVEDLRGQVTQVEAKLYGGEVTGARELRDLQRDLESLQRRLHEREEVLLEVMGRLDEVQSGLTTARHTIEEGGAAWERDRQAAEGQITQIEEKLTALRARRAVLLRPIDPPSLTLYERLRRTRGGRAVARVERGACLGCRIVLPSNLFQRARSGAVVVQCSSCERILFVG